MAQTYTIKKGDTLSKIASEYGVGLGDISGYRSGDPNKIYEGETLTIGKKETPTEPTYVSEVKDQLGTGGVQGTKTDGSTNDPYGIETLRTKSDDYAKKRDEAYTALKDIETSTYNSEYANRGLQAKKDRIAQIDSSLSAARSERDAAIAKARQNPGLSAAQLTGDVKKIADAKNAEINNLISERNSVASEYNTGLAEIDKIVGQKVKDKEREYSYYSGLEKDTKSAITDYQKTLRDELSANQKQSNFEKQLAQAMEIAQIRAAGGGSTTYRLITDPVTGDPLYWIDPKTMETYPAEQGDENLDVTQDGGGDQGAADATTSEEDQPGYFGKLWNALLGR